MSSTAKRKICVVVTARPTYARIKTALEALRNRADVELQLVVAASALLDRYGSAVDVIAADGFEIAARVFMVLEGENPAAMAKTTGIGILELATVFHNLRPDAVITIADRYETLATAVAASYMNIPVIHVQGGEVTGSIDEKVRHCVTKLADLHLVSTELAGERVVKMGEVPDTVHVTGCPSVDLAARILDAPELDFDPFERYGGVGRDSDISAGYAVVLQHPVTTEHLLARDHATETLEAMDALDLPVLWFWPNVDAGSDGTSNAIRSFREAGRGRRMHFFKNMVPTDFLRLLYSSTVLVGNSSVGIRECSFLGVPVVNIGSRQWGRERGQNVVDATYGRNAILDAVATLRRRGRPARDPLYGDGTAGQRIAEIAATAVLRVEKHLAY